MTPSEVMDATIHPIAPTVEAVQLPTPDAEGTDVAAQILRACDTLRRRISTRLTGQEGLFAGYDAMTSVTSNVVGQPVVVSAVAVEVRPALHRVHYVAFPLASPSTVLFSGRGATLTPEALGIP